MDAVILDLLIPAQSLGHTGISPLVPLQRRSCLPRSIRLVPEHLVLFSVGVSDFTGQSLGVGPRVEAEDEWLVEVRGVGWAPSSGWNSLPASALC